MIPIILIVVLLAPGPKQPAVHQELMPSMEECIEAMGSILSDISEKGTAGK